MRAQLLTHALRAQGAQVQVVTTKREGQAFLAQFGIDAMLLSPKPHFAMQYDAQQNMQRKATDLNVASYIFTPTRMLRDILTIKKMMRDRQLVMNDSFHMALMFMGQFRTWGRKIVHVHGHSLKKAVIENFDGRLPQLLCRGYRWQTERMLSAARAQIEHDFAYSKPEQISHRLFRLATPVKIARGFSENDGSVVTQMPVAAYLNPYFTDEGLASALEQGLADVDLPLHGVGVGYGDRPGWLAQDADWVDHAARAPFIVSAPGMAALSVAQVYQRPIMLLQMDQPEQAHNVARAREMGLSHRVVIWRGSQPDFRAQVAQAGRELLALGMRHAISFEQRQAQALARQQAWVDLLMRLASENLKK